MSADPNRKEHQPMPESRSSIKRLTPPFYTMFVYLTLGSITVSS